MACAGGPGCATDTDDVPGDVVEHRCGDPGQLVRDGADLGGRLGRRQGGEERCQAREREGLLREGMLGEKDFRVPAGVPAKHPRGCGGASFGGVLEHSELGQPLVDRLDEGRDAAAMHGFGPVRGAGAGSRAGFVDHLEQRLAVGVFAGHDPPFGVSRRAVGGGLLRWADDQVRVVGERDAHDVCAEAEFDVAFQPAPAQGRGDMRVAGPQLLPPRGGDVAVIGKRSEPAGVTGFCEVVAVSVHSCSGGKGARCAVKPRGGQDPAVAFSGRRPRRRS